MLGLTGWVGSILTLPPEGNLSKSGLVFPPFPKIPPTARTLPKQDQPGSTSFAYLPPALPVCHALSCSLSCMSPKVVDRLRTWGCPSQT